MSVYPERRSGRLTGKWIAEITIAGERRRQRFDSKREGERWSDTIKLTGSAPSDAAGAAAASTHLLGDIAKEAKINIWADTRDTVLGQRLAYVVDTLGAETPIGNITEVDLDRLVASLKKRPGKTVGGKTVKLSPGTINRYLSAASALLTYARKRRYIAGVPEVPWQTEGGKRIHWLTEEAENATVAALEASGKPVYALIVRVLTATGLRWSEFAGLTPEQIVDGWIKLDKTKTNTPRDVPIDAELGEKLRGIIIRGEVPRYYTFRIALKAALKSAGQSAALSVHGLRHTTATRLVHGDVNLAVVKDFLGHSSLNTTLKYTHVSKGLLKEASKILSPHAGQSTNCGAIVSLRVPANSNGLEATPGIEPGCKDLQSDK